MDRFAKAGVLFVGLALAGAAVWTVTDAQNLPPRQFFEIATGPIAGTYFPMGELIARVVSHPPGLARCERKGICGPAGVIVSARTSDGAVANVLAVESGQSASGLAQGNVVADAVVGRGPFRKYGRQTHIRVMADLFPESVQLIVRAGAPIRTVADLKGKRVSIGNTQSGSDVIATEILQAYRVRRVKILREGYEASGGLLRDGKIDAFFYLGGVPAPLIADLTERMHARIVPLDGEGRTRLVARVKGLSADIIPNGAYRGVGRTDTISCHTLWIVKDTAPAGAVYALVRSLYDPANLPMLQQGPPPADQIKLGEQVSVLSVPWHAGALRFYREVGQMTPPKPPKKK